MSRAECYAKVAVKNKNHGTIFCPCGAGQQNITDDQEKKAKTSLQGTTESINQLEIRPRKLRGLPCGSSSEHVLYGKAKAHHTQAVPRGNIDKPQLKIPRNVSTSHDL